MCSKTWRHWPEYTDHILQRRIAIVNQLKYTVRVNRNILNLDCMSADVVAMRSPRFGGNLTQVRLLPWPVNVRHSLQVTRWCKSSSCKCRKKFFNVISLYVWRVFGYLWNYYLPYFSMAIVSTCRQYVTNHTIRILYGNIITFRWKINALYAYKKILLVRLG